MKISERYDIECNSQGNIRWHVRNINGKKFMFCWESEQGYVTVTAYDWLDDVDMEVIDFEKWADGMSWDDAPTKTVKYTGFDPSPRHRFSNVT